MEPHHHVALHHVLDTLAVSVAAMSLSMTLAGVQSIVAIIASLMSATYLAIRIVNDPDVRRWFAKLWK